jgi:hypothetical protein
MSKVYKAHDAKYQSEPCGKKEKQHPVLQSIQQLSDQE